MASVADKKAQASRHKRENIKILKKEIADSEKIVKSMPSKTMKQRQERDAVKNKMDMKLRDKASSMKIFAYNWYIMKAYAEAGLPHISDVAKDYVEKHDENDQPIDKTKKKTTRKTTPKKTVKKTTAKKVSKPKVSTKKAPVPKAKAPVAKTEKKATTKKKKSRTGTPPLLAKMEAKKLKFSSAEDRLMYYYKKLRKEELAKAKKSYPDKPNLLKIAMDNFDETYGPKSSDWSKLVRKLKTVEKKMKTLRTLYIAFWKLGFDEKMLLHQFRIWEAQNTANRYGHGNSEAAIFKKIGYAEMDKENEEERESRKAIEARIAARRGK